MSNLNFKWGLHESLVKMTSSEVGAIYFTKDEGGLYLGVDANKAPKRVQGVVQYYADLSAFKAEVLPPYSSDVIYYIASEGALVKWKEKKAASGDSAATSGEFVVLNVTASEFTAAIDNLNTGIADNADNIATNTRNITDLRTDLGTNDKTGDTAFARIKQLENAVKALEDLAGIGGDDTSGSLNDRIGVLETWKATAHTKIEKLQEDFADHDNTITNHGTKIGNLETWKENADTRIGNLETWKDNTVTTTLKDYGSRLDKVEGDIGIIEGNITDITGDISEINEAITTLNNNLGTNDETDTTAFGRIKDLETAASNASKNIEEINGVNKTQGENILDLQGRMKTAEDNINGLQKDTAEIKADIANVYTKTEVDNQHTSLRDDLTNQLNSHITAANALVYVGGVGSVSEWNTIKSKDAFVGNTYVVTASGETLNINGASVVCYAGDLLIATGTETPETGNAIPAANIQWVHVKAGYNEDLASTLRVIDGDEVGVNKKAAIQLSSYVGVAENEHGDLGEFFIVSNSNNLEIEVSDGKNVNISMVWDSF